MPGYNLLYSLNSAKTHPKHGLQYKSWFSQFKYSLTLILLSVEWSQSIWSALWWDGQMLCEDTPCMKTNTGLPCHCRSRHPSGDGEVRSRQVWVPEGKCVRCAGCWAEEMLSCQCLFFRTPLIDSESQRISFSCYTKCVARGNGFKR